MKILALGEILWDVYEDKSIIGGAPFNFSAHISKIGAQSFFLSAIGNDELYEKTMECVKRFDIKEDVLFVSSEFPTGTCKVTFNAGGQPSYHITEDVAFDNVRIDKETIEKINLQQFDAFYFGTLSQRSIKTRNSLLKILDECTFNEIICDLNLRPNCYNAETILTCLKYCTILKINREEFLSLIELGFCSINKTDYENELDYYKAFCADLAQKYDIKLIIITLDKDGAVVYAKNDDSLYKSSKPKSKVISPVGAGDSFTACFLYNYLAGNELPDCTERAIALSDFVVTRYEAIPDYTEELYKKIVTKKV